MLIMLLDDLLSKKIPLNHTIKWGLECIELGTTSVVDMNAIPILYFDTQWQIIKPAYQINANNISEVKGIGQFRLWINESSIIPKMQETIQKRTSININIVKYANIDGIYTRIMNWKATKCIITGYWFQSQVSEDDPNEIHGIEISSNGEISYSITQINEGESRGMIATSPWNINRGNG